MLVLFSLLTISFLLHSGCSKPDSAGSLPSDPVPAGTEVAPDPLIAEHPVTEGRAKPGDGPNTEGEPEGSTGTTSIDFAVPEIRPPQVDEMKLDQTLLALVRAQREGGADAVRAMVEEGRVELEAEDCVRVEITVTAATAVAAVKEHITASGGEVTAEFHNRVYALVPMAAVEPLAAAESIWNITVPQVVATPFDEPR